MNIPGSAWAFTFNRSQNLIRVSLFCYTAEASSDDFWTDSSIPASGLWNSKGRGKKQELLLFCYKMFHRPHSYTSACLSCLWVTIPSRLLLGACFSLCPWSSSPLLPLFEVTKPSCHIDISQPRLGSLRLVIVLPSWEGDLLAALC